MAQELRRKGEDTNLRGFSIKSMAFLKSKIMRVLISVNDICLSRKMIVLLTHIKKTLK